MVLSPRPQGGRYSKIPATNPRRGKSLPNKCKDLPWKKLRFFREELLNVPVWGNPESAAAIYKLRSFRLPNLHIREGPGPWSSHVSVPHYWVFVSGSTCLRFFRLRRSWHQLESNADPNACGRKLEFAESHCSFHAGKPFFRSLFRRAECIQGQANATASAGCRYLDLWRGQDPNQRLYTQL